MSRGGSRLRRAAFCGTVYQNRYRHRTAGRADWHSVIHHSPGEAGRSRLRLTHPPRCRQILLRMHFGLPSLYIFLTTPNDLPRWPLSPCHPFVSSRVEVGERPSKQSGAPVAATKGGSSVDHRQRFSTLSASYDDFLFAPVCEEANGMRVSVLSALARMNVDPWEEATRLAAMPKAIAEKTLLSILDLVSGKSWKSPEAAAIAARLVRLLPQPGEAATVATTATATAATGTAIAPRNGQVTGGCGWALR